MQQTPCIFLSAYLFIEIKKRTTNAIHMKFFFLKIREEKGENILASESYIYITLHRHKFNLNQIKQNHHYLVLIPPEHSKPCHISLMGKRNPITCITTKNFSPKGLNFKVKNTF